MLTRKTLSHCPVCKALSSDSEFITSGSIEIDMEPLFFSVDLCRICGALYIRERTIHPSLYTEAYDPEKEHGYREEGLEPLTEEIWNYHNKCLQVEELAELVFPDQDSLAYVEVGSGDGSLFRLFNDHCAKNKINLDATLIESSGASSPCGIIPNCRVISASIMRTAFKAGDNFDIAVLSHCLEHFDNPREVLGIVHEMLKPNAIVYIEVPDGIRSDYSLSLPLGYYHVVNYNAVNLSWMVSQAGFEILNIVQREAQPGLRVIARKTKNMRLIPIDRISYHWTRGTVSQWERRKNGLIKKLMALSRQLKGEEKLILYGAGVHTFSILKELPQWVQQDTVKVTDSNPRIRQIMGIPVIPLSEIDFSEYRYVVISSYTYQNEIAVRLEQLQCPNEKIIRLYDWIFSYDISKIGQQNRDEKREKR